MIAAYVLIWTEVGQAAVVAAALRDVPGVSEAVCVTGPYDVIARAEARTSTSWAGWSSPGCMPSAVWHER